MNLSTLISIVRKISRSIKPHLIANLSIYIFHELRKYFIGLDKDSWGAIFCTDLFLLFFFFNFENLALLEVTKVNARLCVNDYLLGNFILYLTKSKHFANFGNFLMSVLYLFLTKCM